MSLRLVRVQHKSMPQAALQTLDQSLAAAVRAAGPSVVSVARGHGHGTGIVWAADLVISASFHTPDRTRVGVATDGADLDVREAQVIGRDPGTDVAVLRVEGAPLPPARFRELDGLGVGNLALALGRPGRSVRASLRAIGVLAGRVETRWGRSLDHYVASDRQIPRGFAGGPLVDPDGAVIGMNTRTLIRGADLAVPTVTLRAVIDELVKYGGVRRGYLGVGAYPGDGGALIASVDAAGPAAAAGLIPGDILTSVAGAPVTGPDDLRAQIQDRPGASVEIAYTRGGQPHVVSVTLGSKA